MFEKDKRNAVENMHFCALVGLKFIEGWSKPLLGTQICVQTLPRGRRTGKYGANVNMNLSINKEILCFKGMVTVQMSCIAKFLIYYHLFEMFLWIYFGLTFELKTFCKSLPNNNKYFALTLSFLDWWCITNAYY